MEVILEQAALVLKNLIDTLNSLRMLSAETTRQLARVRKDQEEVCYRLAEVEKREKTVAQKEGLVLSFEQIEQEHRKLDVREADLAQREKEYSVLLKALKSKEAQLTKEKQNYKQNLLTKLKSENSRRNRHATTPSVL